MEVGKSRVYLYDASYDPLVVMIQVPDAIDIENPVCEFDEFIYCSSYDQILGDAYCYTFLDSKTILLSLSYGTNAGNYEDEFEYTKRMLIYKKESEQYTTESSCPDIPSVSRGYVGIEVWGGNIPPTKIKVCYKK